MDFFCGWWKFSKSVSVISRLLERWEYMNFSVKLQNLTDISLVPFNIPGNVHFSFSFTSSTLVRRFPCKLVYFWIAFWNLLLNDGLLPSVSNFVIANGFFYFFFQKWWEKENLRLQEVCTNFGAFSARIYIFFFF